MQNDGDFVDVILLHLRGPRHEITNLTKRIPSSEDDSGLAGQEILHFLGRSCLGGGEGSSSGVSGHRGQRVDKFVYIYIYTGCNRRNGPDFGRVFLMLNYTEKPQNTYIQS